MSGGEFRPLILLAGYSAYPRLVNFALMREIADEVGATLLADMAHFAGLVACGVLIGDFSPVGRAQIGEPLPHMMAAKAVALARGPALRVRRLCRRIVENAAALAANCCAGAPR